MKIKSMAILTDVTRCIGCEECVEACRNYYSLPADKPWRWVKKINDLSSARWTTIIEKINDETRNFVRLQCRHCLDPSCVSACIVGALKKTPEGPVIYDRDLCIGCRYCMIACPWDIPRYSWEDTVPYVQKCGMCYERVTRDGKEPACTEACPTGATILGEREDLLAEARRRLAAEPNKYVQKIWGEKEVGGTSVLYISDTEIKLTDLAAPITDEDSLPHRTTKILHQMPMVFAVMVGLMGGLAWVIRRRQLLAGEDGETVGPLEEKETQEQ